MRHLMLALMIVLLPLRGWVGDAMATGMATGMATNMATGLLNQSVQHPLNAIKSIAGHTHAAGAESHLDHQTAAHEPAQSTHDCAGHVAAQGTDTDDHCSTCGACQACHTVALSPPGAELNVCFSAATVSPTGTTPFTSAAAALGQKPPIS